MKGWIIYIAGPLFSIAEQSFNSLLVNSLTKELPEVTFILPQIYSKEITGQDGFLEKMFHYCLNSIDQADAMLCILDGPDADSGTSVEMGYAYAHKKPIIGVRSDFRSSEDNGLNLMVSHVCTETLWLPSNQVELADFVYEIIGALKRILIKRSTRL